MLPRLALTLALAVVLPAGPVLAQTSPPPVEPQGQAPAHFDAPAYISLVDGSATLERDGRVETSALNMPLLTGDRLKTQEGRIEVRFADGGRLLLDSRTSIDVLSDALVRLNDGRVRVFVVRAALEVSYRIDSPAASVRIFQPGDYRVALLHGTGDTQLEFDVASGAGEIFTDQGSTPVRAGERAYASAGLLPSYAYAFNSANADDFDRWVELQHQTVYASTSQSDQYLPPDMNSYAPTFDQYGDWRYQQTYGYVWYPRVAADWHPYYYGRWASYPSYGWTWIAADPFGYPTHHYGRWGFSAGAWFWIPSSYWGPAYVSWAYAPSYVSWCPLGWNNYAVFSIGYYNAGPVYYASHYHAHYYNAWTTVPYGHFGHGYAYQHAVTWDHSSGARPQFTQGRSPNNATFTAARATTAAPIRYGGTRTTPAARASAVVADTAVARSAERTIGQSPRYINRGDQIVRSQTARPIAPSDTAVARTPARVQNAPNTGDARTAPPQGAGMPQQRGRYVWDNPSSVPRSSTPQPMSRPSMNGAMPGGAMPRGYERSMPQPQPRVDDQRPAERSAPPSRPSGGSQGEHSSPRPSGTHAAPSSGIARPSGRGR
jgi:hypothetical protein